MNDHIYLVTGGAGFLDSHACSELLERGDRVRTLVLPRDPGAKYVPAAVEQVEGNLRDMASLDAFFRCFKRDRNLCDSLCLQTGLMNAFGNGDIAFAARMNGVTGGFVALIAGSVFAVTAQQPIFWLMILLAIPGFALCGAAYPICRREQRRQRERLLPLIDAKYDEAAQTAQKAKKLL